ATPLPALDVPVWWEPDEPTHPLLGIVTALAQAGSPVVICGCDMPFVAPELLAHLAGTDAALALPWSNGRLHPLLGRYEPALEGPLAKALEALEPVQKAVARLGPVLLNEQELQRFNNPNRSL